MRAIGNLLVLLALIAGVRADAQSDEVRVFEAQAGAKIPKKTLLPITKEPEDWGKVKERAERKVEGLHASLTAFGTNAPDIDAAIKCVDEVRQMVADIAKINGGAWTRAEATLRGGGKLGYDVQDLLSRSDYVYRTRMELTYGYFLIAPANECVQEVAKQRRIAGYPLSQEVSLETYCTHYLPPGQELHGILKALDPQNYGDAGVAALCEPNQKP